MSNRDYALKAFKIVALGHALPQPKPVKEMVTALLNAKREGRLGGMRGGFTDYLRELKQCGFQIEIEETK